jgi:CHAD domain-containing protein
MPLDPDKLEQPLDKLRKSLNKLPKQPSADQVHDIRTRTRRVEATLHALHLDRKRKGRRTLKAVAPVRKRAGKVRDMDVLMAFASTLSSDRDNECLVQLLEHLGQQRFRGARKLHKTAAKKRGVATQSLKRCSSTIKRNFNRKKGRSQWPADASATALQLSSELANWPKLNTDNLHPFRLKIKELRYVLQLSGDSGKLVDMLGEVKDKVGEWHDWTELATIAKDVLEHSGRCDVLEQIRSGAKRRFDEALALANRLRAQYFDQSHGRNKRGSGALPVKEPVLKATAKLAA